MLVLDSAGLPCIQVQSFLDLTKEVKIENNMFRLSYITLHAANHFTSLHFLEEKWLFYDGMQLNGKLIIANKTHWANKAVVNAVYFRK